VAAEEGLTRLCVVSLCVVSFRARLHADAEREQLMSHTEEGKVHSALATAGAHAYTVSRKGAVRDALSPASMIPVLLDMIDQYDASAGVQWRADLHPRLVLSEQRRTAIPDLSMFRAGRPPALHPTIGLLGSTTFGEGCPLRWCVRVLRPWIEPAWRKGAGFSVGIVYQPSAGWPPSDWSVASDLSRRAVTWGLACNEKSESVVCVLTADLERRTLTVEIEGVGTRQIDVAAADAPLQDCVPYVSVPRSVLEVEVWTPSK
jgi:hypothetical protein